MTEIVRRIRIFPISWGAHSPLFLCFWRDRSVSVGDFALCSLCKDSSSDYHQVKVRWKEREQEREREGRKEGRKEEGRKEGRKEGKKLTTLLPILQI
jgi:hypothetical protein